MRLSRHRRPDQEQDGVLGRLNCPFLQPFNLDGGYHGACSSWPRRPHRDKSGKIDKKHGNTRVASLRKEYGASFAKGRRKDMMLKDATQRDEIGVVA